MKSRILKLLVASLLIGALFFAVSCNVTIKEKESMLSFELVEGKNEYRVVGLGAETGTDIVIPSIYKGLPVTEIGDGAFYACDITSVVIDEGVKSIGRYAFRDCLKLMSVVVPDSVTTIGGSAFSCCFNLTSVSIGNGVTVIDEFTFYSCKNLIDVKMGDSVTVIGYSAFYSCLALTSIVIPKGVTTIEDSAFEYCQRLKNVYYEGKASYWWYISIENFNYRLHEATRYYYIENEADVPSDGGNYWHYDQNGEIEIWS